MDLTLNVQKCRRQWRRRRGRSEADDRPGREWRSGRDWAQRSTGTWYKLLLSGGTPTRGQGFDNQGTWTVVDTSGMNGPTNPFQLNLSIAGSGTVITSPAFATSPRKMRLNNEGVFVADYVACP